MCALYGRIEDKLHMHLFVKFDIRSILKDVTYLWYSLYVLLLWLLYCQYICLFRPFFMVSLHICRLFIFQTVVTLDCLYSCTMLCITCFRPSELTQARVYGGVHVAVLHTISFFVALQYIVCIFHVQSLFTPLANQRSGRFDITRVSIMNPKPYSFHYIHLSVFYYVRIYIARRASFAWTFSNAEFLLDSAVFSGCSLEHHHRI